MRKNALNYLVNLLALLAMPGLVFTGLLIRYILPPGS